MKRAYHAFAAMMAEHRRVKQAALPPTVALIYARELQVGQLILDGTHLEWMRVARIDPATAPHYLIITGWRPDGRSERTSKHVLDDLLVRREVRPNASG